MESVIAKVVTLAPPMVDVSKLQSAKNWSLNAATTTVQVTESGFLRAPATHSCVHRGISAAFGAIQIESASVTAVMDITEQRVEENVSKVKNVLVQLDRSVQETFPLCNPELVNTIT